MSDREFHYLPEHFDAISALVYQMAGIVLANHKQDMVYARLSRRLRELKLTGFGEYCAILADPEAAEERGRLINYLTTNLTKFFREQHHLDHLQNQVLPALAQAMANVSRPRLRIWSAGCSTGEEPYSIAMVLRATISDLGRWDARILATDIDTRVLEHARTGVYPAEAANGVPEAWRRRWIRPAGEAGLTMSPELRDLIAFKPLNLIEEWPMQGRFDAIFCRNVMIYFDRGGRAALVDRFADRLTPEGWLYLGHSESLLGLTDRFEAVGPTTYRRVS